MPTRRRRQLTSVARSVLSRGAQRSFSRTSNATIAANSASARETLSPIENRRYARYKQPRKVGNRSRYTVRSRSDNNQAVGRYVGMAH